MSKTSENECEISPEKDYEIDNDTNQDKGYTWKEESMSPEKDC